MSDVRSEMEEQKADIPEADAPGPASPDLDPLEDLDVWKDTIMAIMVEELASISERVSQMAKDVQSGLANIKTELANYSRLEMQNLRTTVLEDVSSILEDRAKAMSSIETKLELMGEDFAKRISRLEGAKPLPTSHSTPTPRRSIPPPVAVEAEISPQVSPFGPSQLEGESDLMVTSGDEAKQPPSRPSQSKNGKTQQNKPKIVTSIDDLDPELATAIQEHIPKVHNSNEKLSALQFGFFSYKFQEMNITDTKDLHKKSREILKAGVALKIWAKDWKPRGNLTMLLYLSEKIKTMVKKRRSSKIREQFKQYQEERRRGLDPS